MSRWEILGEVIGGFSVLLLPIIMLFVGHALGL